jgi:putative oxidoreductase
MIDAKTAPARPMGLPARALMVHDRLADAADAASGWLLPTLARVLFAATLFAYYWSSALTKLGPSAFQPDAGAYIQIFPRAVEAAGYDFSQLTVFHTVVVLLGTWAEFVLPVLIVVGLFTRLAALGMIGFIVVQSVVDITGHGLGAADIGAWFDRNPSSAILDQRAFWVFLLMVSALRGAGPLSVDRLFGTFR